MLDCKSQNYTRLLTKYLVNIFFYEYLNSSFFLNWCNASPHKIVKSNRLGLRGSVSLILNPFLRVFKFQPF